MKSKHSDFGRWRAIILSGSGWLFVLILTMALLVQSCKEKTEKPLNVLIFLVDDLGWSDLSCYGHQFHETPNIDQLARDGMKFSDAYASCAVCSPTRAAIMTGKYPARLKITDWIPGVVWPHAKLATPAIRYELPKTEKILTEYLKEAGYYTMHVGKWHLGEEPEYWPLERGFDVNIGGHSKGMPGSYFFPYELKTKATDWSVKNLPPGGQEGEYLTDRLTEEALILLEQYGKEQAPFFLNMSYYTVHAPIQGKPELVSKYEEKKAKLDSSRYNTGYAAMVQSLDESVGRILDKLDELGIRDNTLILFTSDNGALLPISQSDVLRAGKGFYYEGGIREPLIASLTGQIEAGSTSDQLASSIDFLPTILDFCEIEKPMEIDGRSLYSLLTTKHGYDERPLFWHYPHYHTPEKPPVGVVRSGRYKLIEFFEEMNVELYDLNNDIGETDDLSTKMPELRDSLRQLLHDWRVDVNADMPVINIDYNPEKPYANAKTGWGGGNRLGR